MSQKLTIKRINALGNALGAIDKHITEKDIVISPEAGYAIAKNVSQIRLAMEPVQEQQKKIHARLFKDEDAAKDPKVVRKFNEEIEALFDTEETLRLRKIKLEAFTSKDHAIPMAMVGQLIPEIVDDGEEAEPAKEKGEVKK